jgi:FAD/FMN-containing dehydrogenase
MNAEALTQLATRLKGPVLQPDSDGYDDARRVWNGNVDKKPALIAKCAGVADVIHAVNFAREQGLGVSVRAGGHHVAGSALLDGGLVIDLSLMRSVRVEPTLGLVRVEGGAQIGDLDRETQAFGLAVPLGLVSETGVAGLTLAGGLGWLRRKYGYSADNLVSADVVTADGRLIRARENENEDLLWALRGGGWDLGVVTSFQYRTYPVGPEVLLLFVAYPASEARRVLEAFHAFGKTAPDEAAPILVFWTFPEGEPYPPEVWGKAFVALAGPYIGPVEDGERVYKPLREIAAPLLDWTGPTPYTDVQRMFDEDYPKGRRYYWKSVYLDNIDGAMDTLIDWGGRRPTPITSLDVWLLGGALSRVNPADTPIAHRNAPYLIGLEANWDDPSRDADSKAWARGAAAALAPFSSGGSYLNFEDLSETKVVADSHGPNFNRLVEVKRKYDPDNLFRSRRGLVD